MLKIKIDDEITELSGVALVHIDIPTTAPINEADIKGALKRMSSSARKEFKRAMKARDAVALETVGSEGAVSFDRIIEAVDNYMPYSLGFLESQPPPGVLEELDNKFAWTSVLGEALIEARVAFEYDTVMMFLLRGIALRNKALKLISPASEDEEMINRENGSPDISPGTAHYNVNAGLQWGATPRSSRASSTQPSSLWSSPSVAALFEKTNLASPKAAQATPSSVTAEQSRVARLLSRITGSTSHAYVRHDFPEPQETVANDIYARSRRSLEQYAQLCPEYASSMSVIPESAVLLAMASGSFLQALEMLQKNEENPMEGAMPETSIYTVAGYTHLFIAEAVFAVISSTPNSPFAISASPFRASNSPSPQSSVSNPNSPSVPSSRASLYLESSARLHRAASAFRKCSQSPQISQRKNSAGQSHNRFESTMNAVSENNSVSGSSVENSESSNMANSVASEETSVFEEMQENAARVPREFSVFCESFGLLTAMMAHRYQASHALSLGDIENYQYFMMCTHAFCARLRNCCIKNRHLISHKNYDFFRVQCAEEKKRFSLFRSEYDSFELEEIAKRPNRPSINASNVCSPIHIPCKNQVAFSFS